MPRSTSSRACSDQVSEWPSVRVGKCAREQASAWASASDVWAHGVWLQAGCRLAASLLREAGRERSEIVRGQEAHGDAAEPTPAQVARASRVLVHLQR